MGKMGVNYEIKREKGSESWILRKRLNKMNDGEIWAREKNTSGACLQSSQSVFTARRLLTQGLALREHLVSCYSGTLHGADPNQSEFGSERIRTGLLRCSPHGASPVRWGRTGMEGAVGDLFLTTAFITY